MTDATQTTDALPLEECLAVMYLNSDLSGAYVEGYRSGYLNEPYNFGQGLAYARGRSAGVDAHGRGAHGSDAPVSVSPWVPSRDGAM